MIQLGNYEDYYILAPCTNCIQLWALSNNFSPVIEDAELPISNIIEVDAFFGENRWLCIKKESAEIYQGDFYPHPQCNWLHRLVKRYAKSDLRNLTENSVGPFNQLYKKEFRMDYEKRGPEIFIVTMNPPVPLSLAMPLVGRGVDYDEEIAKIKAISEIVERLCAYLPARNRKIYASASDIVESNGLTQQNMGMTERWWCLVQNLKNGKESWLPLEYTQLTSNCRVNTPLVQKDSTGMAVHPEYDKAVANGLFEVLERNALYHLWSNKVKIAWENQSLPQKIRPLVFAISNLGYDLYAVPCNENSAFPVSLVILEGDKSIRGVDGPCFLFGAGCAETSEASLEKALFEAYSQLVYFLENWNSISYHRNVFSGEINNFYHSRENAQRLISFLELKNARKIQFACLGDKLQDVSSLVKHINEEIFVVDRGNLLSDYLGLKAVQVIVPEMEYSPPFSTESELPYPFSQ